MSVPFVAGVVTRGLAWWQQGILAPLCVCVVVWAIVQTIKADRLIQSKQQPDKRDEHEPIRPQLPDITVKDSDPKVYVEFADQRGFTAGGGADAYFVLVNRGGAYAKIACLEYIYLREHLIKFSDIAYSIAPRNSANIVFTIESPGTHPPTGDIFFALWQEYEFDLNMHELVIPIKVTYQDEARNLFEANCEMVLHPAEHSKVRERGQTGGIVVVDTRNHQFRKLAIAATAIAVA